MEMETVNRIGKVKMKLLKYWDDYPNSKSESYAAIIFFSCGVVIAPALIYVVLEYGHYVNEFGTKILKWIWL